MNPAQPQQPAPDQPDQGGMQKETCVLIEVDEQGQVSVGTYPNIPEELKAGLQPAKSIDEALMQAKQLLEQGPVGPAPVQAEGNFQAGFKKAQPAGPTPQGY